jgi:hypothetical protein
MMGENLHPMTDTLTATDRAAIQQRVLRVLTLGQIVGSVAMASAVTIGAFVVQEALGDDTPLGGIAIATVTVGTGLMAQILSAGCDAVDAATGSGSATDWLRSGA